VGSGVAAYVPLASPEVDEEDDEEDDAEGAGHEMFSFHPDQVAPVYNRLAQLQHLIDGAVEKSECVPGMGQGPGL
jgi:hypothetical protein